jgi:hypothetical protein
LIALIFYEAKKLWISISLIKCLVNWNRFHVTIKITVQSRTCFHITYEVPQKNA